jgi:glycosyltransferase involved in cell wall biosynthesis
MSLLIIQIPCFNEEHTLPPTLADLPREVPGVDRVEWLIIDDGCSDRTVEVAREHGVHHCVSFPANRGLAAAFRAGIDACLKLGADYIVNTDGDNQYDGGTVAALAQPVIEGRADVVIGDRKPGEIAHFSFAKRKLQNLGSWVVRRFSGTDVPDATSGFRCWSREAALRMNLTNQYTYTLESIIQQGHSGLTIASVYVPTNDKTRESRLMSGIRSYVQRSATVILRSYLLYHPFKTFMSMGMLSLLAGSGIGARFVWFYWQGQGAGKIQSLILAAALLIIGVQLGIMAMVSDLVSANRKLAEETLLRVRRLEANTKLGEGDWPVRALNPRERTP